MCGLNPVCLSGHLLVWTEFDSIIGRAINKKCELVQIHSAIGALIQIYRINIKLIKFFDIFTELDWRLLVKEYILKLLLEGCSYFWGLTFFGGFRFLVIFTLFVPSPWFLGEFWSDNKEWSSSLTSSPYSLLPLLLLILPLFLLKKKYIFWLLGIFGYWCYHPHMLRSLVDSRMRAFSSSWQWVTHISLDT